MGDVTREMAKHDVRIRTGNMNVLGDQGIVELWMNASSPSNTVKR